MKYYMYVYTILTLGCCISCMDDSSDEEASLNTPTTKRMREKGDDHSSSHRTKKEKHSH